MKKMLALAFCLALCTSAFAAPKTHNGLWWKEKSGIYKEAFLSGYKQALAHGNCSAVDIGKYPANELIDGLDTFYKDFRNRSILIEDALGYVADQLRGVPDDKLAAELQKLRQSAVQNTDE